MLFVEDRFLVFFLVVFTVYWLLRRNGPRKVWLLLASCVFYGAWGLHFLALMFFSTGVDYLAGGRIHRATTQAGRKFWLLFALTINLGLLCFFKYYNFSVTTIADALHLVGLPAGNWTLPIVLPIGISFYTFHTLSYTLDIYFRRLEPVKNPLDMGVFVTFFPTLVAGPIVRAVFFLPQLTTKRLLANVDARAAITQFTAGFIKKACISDNVAPFAGEVFSDPSAYGPAGAWLGMVLFHIQVYCDFSGYADMALGLGKLMGYELPKNFDFPYFTRSMTRFWQHWHISLGRWFTDYVYIPLGGNRLGPRRTLFNIFTIMFLSGLWHGSTWNFVIWGALHGMFMVIERAGLHDWLERKPRLVGMLWVHFVWLFTLTLFRTSDLPKGVAYMRAMFLPIGMPEPTKALDPRLWLIYLGFLAVHWVMWKDLLLPRLARVPTWGWALGLGCLLALVMPWVATNASPFIYFQF
jgi:alginate O-acetyltransferase complex protein AlgI